MFSQVGRGAIGPIARAIHAATKEPVVHDNDRERSLADRDLHHAGNRQSVTGIVDQVTGIKLIFILERGTDMDLPILKIMLAKSFKRIRKDQFFDGWSWRGCECGCRKRGRG